MYISKNIETLRFSVIREMSQLAAGLEDVITLGIGEPDFDTPAPIIDRAFADAVNGHTHYTPSQGDPELLEKLSASLSKERGRFIPPSAILVTHGAMNGLAAAFRTLLEPGDEVIVIEPHFPDYLAHILFAHGKIVPVATSFDAGFIPDPAAIEAAVTDNTRVILVNSPNNPTGAVMPVQTLEQIAKIARDNDLAVISDEVYDRISFEGAPPSIYNLPGMAQRTLVVNSFSKTYAMTGWRIGFTFGPQEVISQLIKVVNYSTACASSVGQRAAIAALDLAPGVLGGMASRFEKRVDLVCSRLEAMPGVRVKRPRGSFYVFVDISELSMGSREFALALLENEKLVVVPGYAFGASCDGCIRMACTLPKDRLSSAMDRLERFLESRMGK